MYDQTTIQIRLDRFKQSIKNYDNIRFKSYRIGLKLKFLQNESKFYLIDLFNTIESFREFGLNTLDLNSNITMDKIHAILYSIYHHLSRRSIETKDIDIDYSILLIYNWITEMFNGNEQIDAFTFKISLTLLSSSLLSNKLKYFFTLLSSTSSPTSPTSSSSNDYYIEGENLNKFIQCLIKIGVYFDQDNVNENFKINTNERKFDLKEFINLFTNVDQYEQIQWLLIYHRLFDSETVKHFNIKCDTCNQQPIQGFRYKCKICSNYNQCQQCFWYGKTSRSHDPDYHPCKEYLFDKTTTSSSRPQLRQSFRRSFRKLLPKHENKDIIENKSDDDLIKKKLNLTISSPTSTKSNSTKNSKNEDDNEFSFKDFDDDQEDFLKIYNNNNNNNDEHCLIEHYLNLLHNQQNDDHKMNLVVDNNQNDNYEKIIEELERKNQQLMLNINELINNQKNDEKHSDQYFNELTSLRKKRNELEQYLGRLQDQRRTLVEQINSLMNELNIQNNQN